MPQLTKSLFMNGEQCIKLLWHSHRKELPKFSLSDLHKFAQGREFEKHVKKLFPSGIDLGKLNNQKNVEETTKLLAQKKVIFEAGISVNNLFIKADILESVKGNWNLYEIKASTEVKPEHIPDVAFQKHVCEKAGLKINQCFVLFLNKEYVKKGEINPKKLILNLEITEEVNKIKNIEEHSKKYLQIIENPSAPDISIGKHCNHPHECLLKPVCWNYLPEHNVLQLTNWRMYWALFDKGILDIKDIPKEIELTYKDQVIKKAVDKNKVLVNKEEIRKFLDSLHFPLYYFDFETFDTAVPLFDNSRPYQKIPFQYSLHIQEKEGEIKHLEFLANENEDPRIALLDQLKKEIGTSGDIIVFNKSFEISVLTKLAEDFPEHKEWINIVLKRIVDLAEPFKNFYYYNPNQKGQYSIKKVLPSVTGKGYNELDINNGGDASMQFFNSHILHELKNVGEIRKNLLKYCGLDTEGMIWIVKELKKLVR